MKLRDILQSLGDQRLYVGETGLLPENVPGRPETDNRKIAEGDVFVCIKGFSVDGHAFAADARQRGASLVIYETAIPEGIPGIKVRDSRKAAAILAGLYYGDPSASFTLIGITGTNGKTTTSLVIYNALRALGIKAGWIGTLGYYLEDELHETHHTTPDIMELNEIFAAMVSAGVSHVVMEVSSHAIALDRVYGLKFDLCLFSNLSRDHLDFHRDMEEYAGTKFGWLTHCRAEGARIVINTDDAAGAAYHAQQSGNRIYSVGSKGGDFVVSAISALAQRSSFRLSGPKNEYHLGTKLIGVFNIYNVALATAALALLGIPAADIELAIASVPPVRGRFESVPNNRGIGVFIDYAHTPDAIESILHSCKELPHRRIICVFGAGGDRDKGKRPLMLRAALENSDAVIITDDNPRTENPDRIVLDILEGAKPEQAWWIIRDRAVAIRSAIDLAAEGDLVVICGKGHETYQEIGGIRHDFDDHRIAGDALNEDRAFSGDEGSLVIPVDELQLRYMFAPASIGSLERPTNATYRYLITDSRKIVPDSVFFAVKGDRFDGNDFLDDVLKYAGIFALGTKDRSETQYIRVSSGLEALATLCRKYLLMFGAERIALTGSTGKTSTKEILASILSSAGKVLRTAHNENNLMGVCKTIMRIKPEDRYAVFEIGTNHFGEIAQLASVCVPQSAMIINIGPSHLEYLESEDGVFREKSTLFDRELQHILYPAEDQRFAKYKVRGHSVGQCPEADYAITAGTREDGNIVITIKGEDYALPTDIPHFIGNAGFGIAMALELGLSPEQIRQGLLVLPDLGNRMNRLIAGERLIIVDCYNANPVSMQKSIEYWLGVAPDKPHIAILGDMLELGPVAEHYHKMIGAILSDNSIDGLITVGDLSHWYQPYYLQLCPHYNNVDELLHSGELLELPKDAVILLKASHGIHLENAISTLMGGI